MEGKKLFFFVSMKCFVYKHCETNMPTTSKDICINMATRHKLKGPRHHSGPWHSIQGAWLLRSQAHASVLFFGQGDKKDMNSVAGFTFF